MEFIIWLIVAIITSLAIAAAIIIKQKQKGVKREADYRIIFMIGIMWLTIGASVSIISHNAFFIIIGLVFMAIGAANKKRWPRQPLPSVKKNMMIVLLALGLLIFVLTALNALWR